MGCVFSWRGGGGGQYLEKRVKLLFFVCKGVFNRYCIGGVSSMIGL